MLASDGVFTVEDDGSVRFVELPTSPPQIEPARLPPQMGWDFDELEGAAAG